MAQIIHPNAETAELLAALAIAGFEGHGNIWIARDFAALASAPGTVVLADDAADSALLILRVTTDEAEILDFGVAPAARRRGLGRGLLRAAVAIAGQHGATRLFLEVAADNVAAIALYTGGGFAEVGRRKQYYLRADGTRADALILARELQGPGTV